MKQFSLITLLFLLVHPLTWAIDESYKIQCDTKIASQCQVDAMTTQGWETYHSYCKKCHAEDALGSDKAPNLVESLESMTKDEFFANLLLNLPKHHKWQDKPQVSENKKQLWIYLRARADKALPPGRLNVPETIEKPYQVVCGKAKETTVNPCQVDKATFEGWRIFHAFCQGCHARDAQGSIVAPHLLESLQTMSKQVFSEKLLDDYQVYHPWIAGHEVATHVDELWAYLKARTDGVLPVNRPGQLQ